MAPLLRVVDLFSGTGGLSLGFEATGACRTVLAVDHDPVAARLWRANWSASHSPLLVRDVGDLDVRRDVPPHDLLVAGFPCQPWSRAHPAARGADDPRARSSVRALLAVLGVRRPPAFCLENVPRLLAADGGAAWDGLRRRLRRRGYHVRHAVIDAAALTGGPQRRRRLYIVGFRSATAAARFAFPVAPGPVPPGRRRPERPPRWLDPVPVVRRQWSTLGLTRRERRRWFPRGTVVAAPFVVHHRNYGTVRRAADPTAVPTLTHTMGHGWRNVPVLRDARLPGRPLRRLTAREAFRLQGYPEDYQLPPDVSPLRLWSLAGNAVHVPTVRRLAAAVVGALMHSPP